MQLPRTAVILAAGNGSRLGTCKPLLRVGGLYLLERSILTLHAAGIERFSISVGFKADQDGLSSLAGIEINWALCPDYNRGNGVSLAGCSAGVAESFLVAMADHVMSLDTVRRFRNAVTSRVGLPQLATDADIESVFDLDDATKVYATDGLIESIGKQLTDYNLIDMGLFYFPAGSANRIATRIDDGATSVSEIVHGYIADTGFGVVPVANAEWQDVDTPEMAAEAERRFAPESLAAVG